MGRYCSFGEIDKNYFYVVLTSSITIGIGLISMYLFKKNSNSGIVEGIEANKLLKTFLKYLGLDLWYFAELILQKHIKTKKGAKNSELIYKNKRRAKIIDYIFSDSKNKFSKKDILYFIFICLLLLFDDFMIIFIKVKKEKGFAVFNEEYNSIEFFILFTTSIFVFKIIYYKHQHVSIILIILLEIFRYLIKIFNDNNFSISVFILQIIRALCDCIIYGYIKALMEYKYFSPYKCCYIFGFINTPIMIVLYIILSHISFKESNLFCSLRYNKLCCFDNFYYFFNKINFIQILTLSLYTLCNGLYQLLINITIDQYTICHLFMPSELAQFIFYINESHFNLELLLMVIISCTFEFIFILIFIEAIVLNFLGLISQQKSSLLFIY